MIRPIRAAPCLARGPGEMMNRRPGPLDRGRGRQARSTASDGEGRRGLPVLCLCPLLSSALLSSPPPSPPPLHRSLTPPVSALPQLLQFAFTRDPAVVRPSLIERSPRHSLFTPHRLIRSLRSVPSRNPAPQIHSSRRRPISRIPCCNLPWTRRRRT
ncbi:hypothetical protein K505DRAFT_100488 [Melanomma pulvis-pyrius CBS 109.77]|uniref:Uncharacterized protein n=1 Tax=Melanomma pulvis-pyrius CBS 109.77 TaxID=1314802 RepID=A0A6A6WZ38_9PLEO|nr:hypothetical protein K505DRAFT_100488 [Melanomma pulvis-pyrius CBS 109.77]